MRRSLLEARDIELLRTLGRLRFVTGKELRSAFFSDDSRGYQRLRELSANNLIASHRKGAPPGSTYSAWRLTARGIDSLARVCPDEELPDGLSERLIEASLYNLEHREAISRLYFDLITFGLNFKERGQNKRGEVLRRAAVLSRRARQLSWKADGDVILRYQNLGKECLVIPDATVVSKTKAVRIFVEMDRSTKPLRRIRQNLERYAEVERSYATYFADGLPWRLLYVVPSKERLRNIERVSREILGSSLSWKVLTAGEAADWLRQALLFEETSNEFAGADAAASRPEAMTDATRKLYQFTNALLKDLRQRGVIDDLMKENPQLLGMGTECMKEVYRGLQSGGG